MPQPFLAFTTLMQETQKKNSILMEYGEDMHLDMWTIQRQN